MSSTNNAQPTERAIKARILLYMAWRNLTFKKFRSILTIIGVVIGAGSVFFLLSFGLGLQNLVQKRLIGSTSINTINVSTANSKLLSLSNDSVDKFSQIEHVQKVGRLYSLPGTVNFDNSKTDTVIFAADTTFRSLSELQLKAGKFLGDSTNNQVMVNLSLLKAIGLKDYHKAVGKKIYLSAQLQPTDKTIKQSFTIIGVVDSGSGSEVLMPASIITHAGLKQFSQVRLVIDNRGNIPDVRNKVESLGFKTDSPVDTLNQVNEVFKFFNFILLGFGSIGMIIAILGMINTLTVSLLERTKEIGLLVSMGGREKDMNRLFKAEALILSLVGGVIGIVGSMILGGIINAILNSSARGRGVSESFQLFAYPLWLIAVILIFISLVGLIVVYIPARRAARINPIDALRHE